MMVIHWVTFAEAIAEMIPRSAITEWMKIWYKQDLKVDLRLDLKIVQEISKNQHVQYNLSCFDSLTLKIADIVVVLLVDILSLNQ